ETDLEWRGVNKFMGKGSGKRMQVHNRARRFRAKWGVEDVMLNLGRRSNNDHLVFEKRAVVEIEVPDLVIQDFPQFLWLVGVRRTESQHVRSEIVRNIFWMPELLQSARTQCFKFRFACDWCLKSQLPFCDGITNRSDLLIELVQKENN